MPVVPLVTAVGDEDVEDDVDDDVVLTEDVADELVISLAGALLVELQDVLALYLAMRRVLCSDHSP